MIENNFLCEVHSFFFCRITCYKNIDRWDVVKDPILQEYLRLYFQAEI